jgi:hypothetical protein
MNSVTRGRKIVKIKLLNYVISSISESLMNFYFIILGDGKR